MAIHKWRSYLLGLFLNIKIDQQSFEYLFEQKVGSFILLKWVSKLIGYDFCKI